MYKDSSAAPLCVPIILAVAAGARALGPAVLAVPILLALIYVLGLFFAATFKVAEVATNYIMPPNSGTRFRFDHGKIFGFGLTWLVGCGLAYPFTTSLHSWLHGAQQATPAHWLWIGVPLGGVVALVVAELNSVEPANLRRRGASCAAIILAMAIDYAAASLIVMAVASATLG